MTLPHGWTEATPGGMACNPDPLCGGIIDKPFISGDWFIVFNRAELPLADGFASREDAFDAFFATLSAQESNQSAAA